MTLLYIKRIKYTNKEARQRERSVVSAGHLQLP
nr:MAG TPA: hypothetical protein [Caudoviricetes sp.]